MAVDINSVYQKVLALANKEQRGYITPQEFNLLADKAQLEIFENYFHNVKMTEAKPKNQLDYADEMEMLEEKLHPFFVDQFWSATSVGGELVLTMPTNMYKIISITREGNLVTQLNKSQIAYTENNPLTKATVIRSVFVREDSGVVMIYPPPSSSTFNIVAATNQSGLNNDTEQFEVNYYKKPTSPNWGYVIANNNKALYNVNTSTNFELHGSEEENLVSRILLYAGVITKSPDIQTAGAGSIQMVKQEQNS